MSKEHSPKPTTETTETTGADDRIVSPVADKLRHISDILEKRKIDTAHRKALAEYKHTDREGYTDHLEQLADPEKNPDVADSAVNYANRQLRVEHIRADVIGAVDKTKERISNARDKTRNLGHNITQGFRSRLDTASTAGRDIYSKGGDLFAGAIMGGVDSVTRTVDHIADNGRERIAAFRERRAERAANAEVRRNERRATKESARLERQTRIDAARKQSENAIAERKSERDKKIEENKKIAIEKASQAAQRKAERATARGMKIDLIRERADRVKSIPRNIVRGIGRFAKRAQAAGSAAREAWKNYPA